MLKIKRIHAPSVEIGVQIHFIPLILTAWFSRLQKGQPFQSIFASASRLEGVKLFASWTLGDTIFVLRPESFLRATMTGADDLVTR